MITKEYDDYSVLMSVYIKEKPDFLRLSIESMMSQTVPTNDFVLICDGPLTNELNQVIGELQEKYKKIINVVRFEENRGLGHALNVGVKTCKNDIIARMDSDDISRSYRCERELEVLCSNKDISIVGSNIEEFVDNPDIICSKRIVPENYEQIVTFSKMRNPFNHPSVMFRKEDVLKVGNYTDVRFMQDYYLWIDMLIAGFKGYNIQDSLVLMRAGNNLYKRRSGVLYIKIQINLFRKMLKAGYISNIQFLKSVLIRIFSSLSPNWLRKFIFTNCLRSK